MNFAKYIVAHILGNKSYFQTFQLAGLILSIICLLSTSLVRIKISKMGLNGPISRKSLVKLKYFGKI